MKKPKKKIDALSNWEWTTLVAAWRYYQYRATISSNSFPGDIIQRFWASGKYSDKALTQIANQFANIDHNGESNWNDCGMTCDRNVWCKFYAFCKAWCDGFKTLTLELNATRCKQKAFYCERTKRWYPVDGYIANPWNEKYFWDDAIKEVKSNA